MTTRYWCAPTVQDLRLGSATFITASESTVGGLTAIRAEKTGDVAHNLLGTFMCTDIDAVHIPEHGAQDGKEEDESDGINGHGKPPLRVVW